MFMKKYQANFQLPTFSPVLRGAGCGLQSMGHGLLGVGCGMQVTWRSLT